MERNCPRSDTKSIAQISMFRLQMYWSCFWFWLHYFQNRWCKPSSSFWKRKCKTRPKSPFSSQFAFLLSLERIIWWAYLSNCFTLCVGNSQGGIELPTQLRRNRRKFHKPLRAADHWLISQVSIWIWKPSAGHLHRSSVHSSKLICLGMITKRRMNLQNIWEILPNVFRLSWGS